MMTAPVKIFKDSNGNEIVQMSKAHYDKMQRQINSIKLAKAMHRSMDHIKKGNFRPVPDLLK